MALDPDKRLTRNKRRRERRQEKALTWLQLSYVLDPEQHRLICMRHDRRMTWDEIASEMRLTVRIVRTKVAAAERTMQDPMFGFVMEHRDDMSETVRRFAELRYLQGKAVNAAAENMGIGFFDARIINKGLLIAAEIINAGSKT